MAPMAEESLAPAWVWEALKGGWGHAGGGGGNHENWATSHKPFLVKLDELINSSIFFA